jgi:bifunctional non-homologous end joining protein LigD
MATAPLPKFVRPQLATLVDEVPRGDGWIHEIKLDGYRMQLRVDGSEVTMRSRNGHDWTARFPRLVEQAQALRGERILLDGEVVHVDRSGHSSFSRLVEELGKGARANIVYQVFDLLYIDGEDWTGEPLLSRKRRLSQLLQYAEGLAIRYSDHVEGQGEELYRTACRQELEGIISKLASGPYRPGRSRDWLKVKCVSRQELVLCGYTPSTKSLDEIGSLILGVHDRDGVLRYAGRVGTGFTTEQRRELKRMMDRRTIAHSPFAGPVRERGMRDARWAAPDLVGEVAFMEWTEDGRLRHPSFQGLREDKEARDVVLERPAAPPDGDGARPNGDGARPNGDGARRAARERPASSARRPRAPAAPPSSSSVRASEEEVRVDGVRLTAPDQVLHPQQALSKRDLLAHYRQVESWLMPYLRDRPLLLLRCADGDHARCFQQKHAPRNLPAAIGTVAVAGADEAATYMYVTGLAGLAGLVELGAVELHVWSARRDRLERPDRVVFDLDPAPDVAFPAVVDAAREVRDRLTALGLQSFVMTTGGEGLHVVVPLDRRHDFAEVHAFARTFARVIASAAPTALVAQGSLARRTGKILVDSLRNARGATAVCPYSPRARSGAPVATPLRWDELAPGLHPAQHTVSNMAERMRRLRADPWRGYGDMHQRITSDARRMLGMEE